MFKHILLPIDGSELSLRAAKMGIELAKTCGARVHALHVVPAFQALIYMSEALAASEATYTEQSMELAAEYLDDVKRLAEEAGVKYSGHYDVAEHPHEVILQTAREKRCDLVVMASHGRRGLSRLLLGSETQKVLLQGEVPVLVCS
jgi:nucleotide-binding universal stress UspA family protein